MPALLLLLICTVTANANPTIQVNKVAVNGGVCTVTGTVSIAKGDTFQGSGFYVTNTKTAVIYNGVSNLPAGPPTAGGAAVAITGTSPMLPNGAYTYSLYVFYNGGILQKASAGFSVP